MNLGKALSKIAEDIRPAEDQQAVFRLAEYIFAHKKDIKHLTYYAISQVVDIKRPEKLLQIAQYLSGERVKLLEMKFELIIDDCVTQLDDETVYHAETTGSLIHPETGYPVENYTRYVYPYFIPSSEVENG